MISTTTQFSLRVLGVFEVSSTSDKNCFVDEILKDFIVNGTCQIDDGLKNVEIGTAEYNLQYYTPDNQTLSDMILPYINDMDEEAHKFHLKYQPQALI